MTYLFLAYMILIFIFVLPLKFRFKGYFSFSSKCIGFSISVGAISFVKKLLISDIGRKETGLSSKKKKKKPSLKLRPSVFSLLNFKTVSFEGILGGNVDAATKAVASAVVSNLGFAVNGFDFFRKKVFNLKLFPNYVGDEVYFQARIKLTFNIYIILSILFAILNRRG